VCTHLDVGQSSDDPSKVIVSNICNKKTPDGKLIIANGTLSSSRNPADGRYNETIGPNPKPVAYNIIVLQTNDYSVEYDCAQEFGLTNYCVHILSRQPTLNETIVNNLLKLAEQYDLNPTKLDFVLTKQMNCNYPTQIGHTYA
jgi:apolipoprotein D and lipocalin family protein